MQENTLVTHLLSVCRTYGGMRWIRRRDVKNKMPPALGDEIMKAADNGIQFTWLSMRTRQNKISTPFSNGASSSSSGVLSLVNGPNTQEFNKSDKTAVYKLIIPLCVGPVFRADAVFVSQCSREQNWPRASIKMGACWRPRATKRKLRQTGVMGSSSQQIHLWIVGVCFHFTLSNSITSTPFAHRKTFPIEGNRSRPQHP